MMNCKDLAERIERLQPGADPRDVARLCLLLANSTDDLGELDSDEALTHAWHEMGMKVQMATDQHAAMTQELEALAANEPQKFTPDQIWILLRAIKVQSQILQLYLEEPAVNV